MKKILYFIFPYLKLINTETIIKQKIDDILTNKTRILEKKDLEEIEISSLEAFYKNSGDVKKTIEDKAKTGILGITITIGLIASITTNYDKLSVLSSIIFIIALFYSLCGGYIALKVLGDKNTIYQFKINDLKLKDNDLKEALAINSELNIKTNINRQNYVYASYRHLVYSIMLMVFALLLNIVLHKKIPTEFPEIIVDCNILTFKNEQLLKNKISTLTKSIKVYKHKVVILKKELKKKKVVEYIDNNTSDRETNK